MIRISCPACGKRLKMPEDRKGRRLKCPTCGSALASDEELPEQTRIAIAEARDNILAWVEGRYYDVRLHLNYEALEQIVDTLFDESVGPDRESRIPAFTSQLDTTLNKIPPHKRLAVAKKWERDYIDADAEYRQERDRRRAEKENLARAGVFIGCVILGGAIGLAKAGVIPVAIGVGAFLIYAVLYMFFLHWN